MHVFDVHDDYLIQVVGVRDGQLVNAANVGYFQLGYIVGVLDGLLVHAVGVRVGLLLYVDVRVRDIHLLHVVIVRLGQLVFVV